MTGRKELKIMCRFVMIGNECVNVDTIKRVEQRENGVNIIYKDGTVEQSKCKYKFDEIWGENHIVQVIPVNVPTVALYRNDDGNIFETDIFYLALTADGNIRAIEECGKAFEFCDSVDNYVGISQKQGEPWRKHIEE